MKPNSRILLLAVLSFYMILTYQNCGQPIEFNSGLSPVNPNAPSSEFINKLFKDAETIESNKCVVTIPRCVGESDSSLSCVEEAVSAYYSRLACMGFDIVEDKQCILAVSTKNPKSMEPVLIDATCFNDEFNKPKSLHLGACHADFVGFDKDRPSVDTGDLSAWMNLGNEQPFSRRTKQMVFYRNQKDLTLKMAHEDSGSFEEFKDACGNFRPVQMTGLQIDIELDSE
ncbi:MAG: hypothetical protein AB8E15_03865 [Bdellovibrionales bacterium]